VRRRLAGCLGLRLKPFQGRRRPLLHQVVCRRLHDDRNHWLLRGEGGSGKSVALHRLAHRLLDRVTRARFAWFTWPPIPLYVDLSAWSLGEGARPSPVDLRNLVVTQATTLAEIHQEGETDERRDHQDVAMAQWLEQWFDHGHRLGWWVLILDGFDEIRALRATDSPHRDAADYHAAIAAFAGRLPTVVASRPFPAVARPGWGVLEMQPLDPVAQAVIVDAWFPGRWGRPGRRVLAELRAPEQRLEGLLPNPLYLAAICLYRRDQHQVPDSPRKAFDHFVNRRLAKYRSAAAWDDLSFESLKQCAARIALEVLRDEAEGRPRERRVLVRDLKRDGWGALIDPDRAIELLHRFRLVRSIGTGEPQESRVLFLHQRILEHFAIEALITCPDAVASKLLLGSATWREVAVGLLEDPDSEAARRLHDAIRGEATRWVRELSAAPRPIGEAVGDEPLGFPWPDGAQDVLGILHAAAERCPAGDADYAPWIDLVLAAAYREGQESDRATVLGLSRAGSEAQRCDLLAQAFDSGRFALATLAYEQTLSLPPPPAYRLQGLIPRMREMVVARWALKRREPGGNAGLRRRLKALDPSGGLDRSRRLLRVFPWVDWVFVSAGILALLLLGLVIAVGRKESLKSVEETYVQVYLFALFVPMLFYWPLIFFGSAGNANKNRKRVDLYCHNLTPSRCVWVRLLVPILVSRSLLVAWGGLLYWLYLIGWSYRNEDGAIVLSEIMPIVYVPWLLAALGLLWAVTCLFGALSGHPAAPHKWIQWSLRSSGPGQMQRQHPSSVIPFPWRSLTAAPIFLLKVLAVLMGLVALRHSSAFGGLLSSDFWLQAGPFVLTALWLLPREISDTWSTIALRCSAKPLRVPALLDVCARAFPIRGDAARKRLMRWAIEDAVPDLDPSAPAAGDDTAGADKEGDSATRVLRKDLRHLNEIIDLIQWDWNHRPQGRRRLSAWIPRPGRKRPGPPLSGLSPPTHDWYVKYARKSGGMAYLRNLLGDLIELRELLRRRIEREMQHA